MDCRDCVRFDFESFRCRDGKVNPDSWVRTVETANIHGVRAICTFNDWREKLVNSRTQIIRPTRKSAKT